MSTIKIRYRGKLIGNQWTYDHPKIVELPIPFISRSMKVGEVVCDPVGEFPEDDGLRLLKMSGDGPFVEEKEEDLSTKKEKSQPPAILSTRPTFEMPKAKKRKGNPNWIKGMKRSTSPKSAAAKSTSPATDAGQGAIEDGGSV